ncbi:putative tRNA-dihydrouridine synthase [Thalassoglobus neptunius]|uniref:tRNA-dihydrouridine synthase n=1 Tax=Thalassoglobus neptunius TaxID=1938619 RepID=A0A5C5X3D3_9PLAN|nr:tRNA-dihydrouridine synthase [Thalassoglobus neptunius]TWT57139.1 putative tRNA-dihydrouridine synthase [Thalassoglobus neptunius]
MTTHLQAAQSVPRSSLRIGEIQLAHPFVQAALSGYSDWAMRRVAKDFGAAYTLAEVMIDRFANEARPNARTRHHFYISDDDHPVGAQLMGSDPVDFAKAAKKLSSLGYDVIDINFGCPVKSAIGGCRGGYHLGQPQEAIEILQRVRENVPPSIPVTLKMRRGIDDSPESRERFFAILSAAYENGLAAVTVHGRTVEQKYRGPSSWEFLKEVKEFAGDRIVLGSGDLFSAEDCVAMLRETSVDGVTIARGAIGNPWIFQQSIELWKNGTLPEPPFIHEQRAVLQQHLHYALELVPDSAYGIIKKFGFKYARLHSQENEIRKSFQKMRSEADWNQILDRFYSSDGPGKFPSVVETQA